MKTPPDRTVNYRSSQINTFPQNLIKYVIMYGLKPDRTWTIPQLGSPKKGDGGGLVNLEEKVGVGHSWRALHCAMRGHHRSELVTTDYVSVLGYIEGLQSVCQTHWGYFLSETENR